MTTAPMTLEVRRLTADAAGIAIGGDVTSAGEAQLIDAHIRASADGTRVIVLDFGRVEYMNSGGIGLLVTLLVRAQRQGQRLMAVHLSAHYREILGITRLDEAIGIYSTEAEALAAAGA